jgi:hypothetical protein
MTAQLLAVIAFVGMAVSMLALGVRIGRRQGRAQGHSRGRARLVGQTSLHRQALATLRALDEDPRDRWHRLQGGAK